MKKEIALFLTANVLFLFSQICLAQVKGGQHSKLFDLYAMEKYEDCAFKAESMVMSEKYKKDPEPLLYLSMCMLKISKMDPGELDQQYKDPLKESLKYAKKFRAKDKDGSMYLENRHFFDELKVDAIYRANSLYNQNQYSKAAAFLNMINAFDTKDDNVRFMKGVCDILAKNSSEGSKSINEAMKGLDMSRSDSAFSPDNSSELLLAEAMIIYSDYLSKNKMEDSAKKTMSVAKEFFPGNREVKNQYNLIHGLPPEEIPAENDDKKTEKRYEFHQPKEGQNIELPESKSGTPSDSTGKETTKDIPEVKEEPADSIPEKEENGKDEKNDTSGER